ncbi:MAG: Crp/Fnr family transcriptional regulator [Solirubrobacterales bacterium]|nr:Crp/Fnr family transcriptional regulator [Solirubrobacterales bacterium]
MSPSFGIYPRERNAACRVRDIRRPVWEAPLRGRLARMRDRVSLGKIVPDLMTDLTTEERAWVLRNLIVPQISVAPGVWDWQSVPAPRAGVLLLTGLLAHRVTIAGQLGADLLGPNHVVQPWHSEPKVAQLVDHYEWRALAPTTFAVLDREYMAAVARIPALAPSLAAISIDHSSMAACQMAILAQPHMEDRLLMLFWHFAERWGKVTPAGVEVSLPGLTQTILAEAIAAGRQSVNRAMTLLRALDLLQGEHGTWLLHSDASSARMALQQHRAHDTAA